MSTDVETLKTVSAELTVEERSELAHFLVDSIDPAGGTDVEDRGIVNWPDEPTRLISEEPATNQPRRYSGGAVRNYTEGLAFHNAKG